MNTEQAHIIHKVSVKVNTNSMENAHYLKDNVGAWITAYILPYLENYVAEIESQVGDQIIQFDKVKLSFDLKSGDFRLEGIPESIVKDLTIQLQPILDAVSQSARQADEIPGEDKTGKIVDAAKREVDTFFHFLKTGKSPWWITSDKLNELLSENNLSRMILRNEKQFFETFFSLLSAENVRTRLIRQFSNGFLYKTIYNSFAYVQETPFPGMYPKELNLILNKLSQSQKEYFWHAAIQLFLDFRQGSSGEANTRKLFKPIVSFLTSKKNKPTQQHQLDIISWLEELIHAEIPATVSQTSFFDVINAKFDTETNNQQENLDADKKSGKESEPIDPSKPVDSVELAESSKSTELKSAETDTKVASEVTKTVDNKVSVENSEETKAMETEAASAISETLADSAMISAIENQPEVGSQMDNSLKEGVLLENAGLILLHPFLKSFLLKVALIDEQNVMKDPFLIAHVFHYMATGKQHDWDHNLLFEKFLCNIPLTTSLPRKMTIPPEIKQEVDELLRSVLEHWKALGSSSIELLRNEFLQRPGKLTADEFSVKLIMERKTHDILMDQLPWGISIARLPWQQQIIYTTW